MMGQFLSFTKKELRESTATFRLYIMLAAFIIFGLMSPLIAKLTPDILNSLGSAGMTISLPDPTAIDAWTQFFKNVGQLGMLVLVIVFCGAMSNEISKGTLVNLLTKGLKRHTVVLSKFLVASVLWAISYLVCLGVCYAYTAYYWGTSPLDNAFLAFLAPWLFGELMLALLFFGGTLFGNNYGSLLSCLAVVAVLNIVAIAPKTARYNPIMLAGGTLSLLTGTQEPADFIPAVVICAVLTVALVAGTVVVFNRKKL
ncbi:MAG: ABC transporter permease [Eggerthellaceae bacterium]|nr:ABC transporter permease [Eggerthellaceae bacterium]